MKLENLNEPYIDSLSEEARGTKGGLLMSVLREANAVNKEDLFEYHQLLRDLKKNDSVETEIKKKKVLGWLEDAPAKPFYKAEAIELLNSLTNKEKVES